MICSIDKLEKGILPINMQKLILIWCVLTRVVGMIMYLEHGNMYSDNVSGM